MHVHVNTMKAQFFASDGQNIWTPPIHDTKLEKKKKNQERVHWHDRADKTAVIVATSPTICYN